MWTDADDFVLTDEDHRQLKPLMKKAREAGLEDVEAAWIAYNRKRGDSGILVAERCWG